MSIYSFLNNLQGAGAFAKAWKSQEPYTVLVEVPDLSSIQGYPIVNYGPQQAITDRDDIHIYFRHTGDYWEDGDNSGIDEGTITGIVFSNQPHACRKYGDKLELLRDTCEFIAIWDGTVVPSNVMDGKMLGGVERTNLQCKYDGNPDNLSL